MNGLLQLTLTYTTSDGKQQLEVRRLLTQERLTASHFPRYEVAHEAKRAFDELERGKGYGE